MTKSTKTNHYTYKITHQNGRYYVGRRSTKKDPLLDSYMGSGKWVKGVKDKSTLTKTIIAYYPTSEELKVGEMELIDKYFDDVYCMNIMYSSCGFVTGDKHPQFGKIGELSHMYGRKASAEHRRKNSDAKSGQKHPQTTITNHIAKLIKIRISEVIKDRAITEEFNTTRQVVSGIRHNRSWKHVTI
jgi:hypothetical protein